MATIDGEARPSCPATLMLVENILRHGPASSLPQNLTALNGEAMAGSTRRLGITHMSASDNPIRHRAGSGAGYGNLEAFAR